MPKFQVLRRVDAYVDYIAEVDASSAEEAAVIACENEDAFVWKDRGEQEFDARLFVTLDENGHELDGTQCGDF